MPIKPRILSSWFGGGHRIASKTQIKGAFDRTFSGEDGDLVLHYLGLYCNLLKNTEGTTAEQRAFEEGKRAAFLHILKVLRTPMHEVAGWTIDIVQDQKEE